MAFQHQYQFKQNNKVVIQHRKGGNFNGGAHVRVEDGGNGVQHDGGKGKFAQWMAEPKGGNKVMFKSTNNGKYLRIVANGNVDCAGGGGDFCVFKVHEQGGGIVKLEATKTGKYLAFRPQQGIHAGGGGDFCKFKVFRDGQGGGGGGQNQNQGGGGQHFKDAYEFKVDNTVVMQHRQNGNFQNFHSIRVNPNNEDVAMKGGKGDMAQWKVERKGGNKVQIKSTKTGKYLRIKDQKVDAGGIDGGHHAQFKFHKDGHAVKLESIKIPGKYIAVDNNGIRIGNGGDHCKLRFFRK